MFGKRIDDVHVQAKESSAMPAFFGMLLVIIVAFQLFYRYETWPSKQLDGIVYERDRLTGETHLIQPGRKIGLIARLTGQYGQAKGNESDTLENTIQQDSQLDRGQQNNFVAGVQRSKSTTNNDAPIPQASSLPTVIGSENEAAPEELAVAAIQKPIVTNQALWSSSKRQLNRNIPEPGKTSLYQMNMTATTDKKPLPIHPQPLQPSFSLKPKATLPSPPIPESPASSAPNHFRPVPLVPQTAAYKSPNLRTFSQAFDLNSDGQMEEVIQTSRPDGQLNISVVYQGKEVLFGKGQQLHILPNKRQGWSDLVLVNPAQNQRQLYRFNPDTQLYVKTILPPVPSGNIADANP